MPVLTSLDSLTTSVWLVADLFVQVGLVICFHREFLVWNRKFWNVLSLRAGHTWRGKGRGGTVHCEKEGCPILSFRKWKSTSFLRRPRVWVVVGGDWTHRKRQRKLSRLNSCQNSPFFSHFPFRERLIVSNLGHIGRGGRVSLWERGYCSQLLKLGKILDLLPPQEGKTERERERREWTLSFLVVSSILLSLFPRWPTCTPEWPLGNLSCPTYGFRGGIPRTRGEKS